MRKQLLRGPSPAHLLLWAAPPDLLRHCFLGVWCCQWCFLQLRVRQLVSLLHENICCCLHIDRHRPVNRDVLAIQPHPAYHHATADYSIRSKDQQIRMQVPTILITTCFTLTSRTVWSKLSNKRWLLNPRHGRLKLSIFTVVFALAVGALTSAFATLLTPSWVPVTENISTQDIDLSAPDLQDWVGLLSRILSSAAIKWDLRESDRCKRLQHSFFVAL